MVVYIVLQVTYTETAPAKITSQIEKWINETLSQPNKAFGNLPPCPYAKKAWMDGNVSVRMFTSFEQFEKGPWDKEVNIYVTDMSAWDLQEAAVGVANRRYEWAEEWCQKTSAENAPRPEGCANDHA